MATFLDDLSIYNAKAAAAITLASTAGDSGKANLMSSLKSTANDTSLTEAVRLNALTALINVGDLLDIPLPPYFPITTTFADSQTYVGVHNDLSGLNVGDFQHLTSAEKSAALNKASLSDITFANLIGIYTDNPSLVGGFALKQNALSGLGYVKASGGSITYDNSTFLTSVTGIVAADTPGGGQLTGTYASPTLSNAAVIAKVLTGFNPSASTGVLSSTDSIFSAIEKLNANVNDVVATSGTINEITFSLPGSVFDFTPGPFTSGAAPLSGTFLDQTQNYFFAGPTGGGTGQPTFRAIAPGDFPVSGATAGTYGSASSIPVIQVDTYGRVTTIANVTAASGGQVNTITYSVPAGVFTQSVTGTSAVSITLGLSTQTATYVWAGPVSGAAAGPTFRALVSTDIPSITLDQVDGLYAYLDFYLPNALATSAMFIGNGSDAAVNASVTGDLALLYVDNAPTNEAEFTIQPGVVSYAKIQDVTGQKLLGRYALADGEAQEITFDSLAFTLNSTTGVLGLVTPNPPTLTTKGDLLTATGPSTQVRLGIGANATLFMADSAVSTGNKWVAMSGDATIATSGAITIGAGAVTLAKMANLAANSFIGNNTGSAATPIALTVTQATAMLNQFTTSLKGLAPGVTGPAIGDATYFLNATGAWSVPAGGGGGSGTVTSVSVVSANGFAGTVATPTVAAAITISTTITGLLKGNGTAISAATAGTDYAPATSGSSILYGNGAGGFSSVTIGTNLSFTGGTLDASSTMVYPGAGIANSTGSAWGTSYSTTGLGTVVALQDSPTILQAKFGNGAGNGHVHFRRGTTPAGLVNNATLAFLSASKTMSLEFEADNFQSQFLFTATASTKIYTLPDATGTVALINASNYLSVPKSGAVSGGIIFDGGTSGTISFEAPLVAGTQSYIFPSAYPGAASGYYLTSNSTGTLAWVAVAGGGDVVGPSSSTDGNFVVFDGTSGKLIAEPTTASFNNSTGRATFNGGVDVGVSSSATGTLIFRNATTAATTTFQASTSQSANLNYTWPISAPTVGQILSSDASGNLSWTAAGSGDMTLAGTQTVTGTKTFNASTIRINNATNNGYHILASLAAVSGTLTATFPAATGTVALLSLAQTFSALQTHSAGLTVSAGTTTLSGTTSIGGAVTMSFAGGATTPQLTISGGTHNFINLTGNTGVPTTPTRSAGTKIVLFSNPGGIDGALGLSGAGELWNSTSVSFGWYCNTTTASLNLTVSALTLTSLSLIGSATQNVFNTVSTTVNFAGAATTLTISSGTTAAQTINMFTGSTGASTYNFATGATASATTKAINIGTGGATGSTTNITFGTAATTNLRFFGSANTSGKPTVSGSKGANAALASLLTAMSNLGLITDSTT